MTRIVVVAHAPLPSALAAVAVHAFPECAARLGAVDVHPGDDLATATQRLREVLTEEDTLILSDAFGATPCNAAVRLADGVRLRVVAGVNVPMVWRVVCYGTEPLDRLVSRAVDGARQGVMQVAVSRPQNQASTPLHHDQVHHHHQ
jgi:PTS system ascorbate-specific IIA component